MGYKRCQRYLLAAAVIAANFLPLEGARSQPPADSVPNPYKTTENWAKLPADRAWGSAAGIALDHKGNVWVFERCGANTCAGSTEAPILEFDSSGSYIKSFGAGMFVFPHGLFIDKNDNIWVTDADGKDGKGHQVIEFSPSGKVMMTLGKAGVAGDGPDTFNKPSGVVVAPDGTIFVADGHGGTSNARIVKLSKDGKFIKAWGKKGTGPGEFGELHSITMDGAGRLLVSDRGNNRIQVFDQDGNFIEQFTQFGRPSAVYVDKKGMIYVPDNTDTRPDWPRGIRVGNLKEGKLTAFIPDPDQNIKDEGFGAENVVVDAKGDIFASEVNRKMVKKYVPE